MSWSDEEKDELIENTGKIVELLEETTSALDRVEETTRDLQETVDNLF